MSDKPSDTPRTNQAIIDAIDGQWLVKVDSDFARTLERELTASAEKCAELERQLAEKARYILAVTRERDNYEAAERKSHYERQDALQSLELVKEQLAEATAGREMFKATAIEGGELAERATAKIRELKAQVKEMADLLRVAKCPNCDGSGATVRFGLETEYVSREMALDAGDPSLEGSVYREAEPVFEQCQWCAERQAALAKLNGGIR